MRGLPPEGKGVTWELDIHRLGELPKFGSLTYNAKGVRK